MVIQHGAVDLRAENVERDVKGFALQNYKFKQVLMTRKGSANQETYFQETAADLTAAGTRNVKGLGRFSEFPTGVVTFQEKRAFIEKYGMEGEIAIEDVLFNSIDLIARTKLRIGRAVAKSVDDEIWDVISESQSASDLNALSITAGNEWDSATVANRDPIQNFLDAKKLMSESNYDPDGGKLFFLMSPKDYANVLGNSKVSNNTSFRAADVVANGRVAQIVGGTIIVSNSVTADFCLALIAKEIGTWVTAVPMQVHTEERKGIKWTIRAFEMGVTQLINPKAGVLIDNTQKT